MIRFDVFGSIKKGKVGFFPFDLWVDPAKGKQLLQSVDWSIFNNFDVFSHLFFADIGVLEQLQIKDPYVEGLWGLETKQRGPKFSSKL